MPDQLTRREVECVQLAGDGLRDKAIAQRLGIGPRTVSSHLSEAYRKLGVSAREDAAAVLRSSYGQQESRIPHLSETVLSVEASTAPPGPADREVDVRTPATDHPWKPLPTGMRRLGLIFAWATAWMIIFGGILPVAYAIFEWTQRFRDGAQ